MLYELVGLVLPTKARSLVPYMASDGRDEGRPRFAAEDFDLCFSILKAIHGGAGWYIVYSQKRPLTALFKVLVHQASTLVFCENIPFAKLHVQQI